MPYTEWQSGPPSPSQEKGEYAFICMSTTVDDLSYTPSEQEKSRDAAQIVATGRRSWKTLKGKGEAVWPPLLEAALLEALEKYQPDALGSRSNKSLGRFPMRNRFISDYILETTGKRRTAKQVGSRLQQLRDTCKGDKILQLIAHQSTPEPTSTRSRSESSLGASPTPPPDTLYTPVPSNQVVVYVRISLQNDIRPAPIPSVHFVNNNSANPQTIQLSPSSSPPNVAFTQGKLSNLSFLCGYVEFPSSTALALQSTFAVYLSGSNRPVHTEIAPLKCISSPMQRSGWLYGSDLVPIFWETLCSSRDLSRYIILQTLKPIVSNPPGHADTLGELGNASRNISVVYKFASPAAPLRRQSDISHPTQPLTYPVATSTRAVSMPPRQSTSSLHYSNWQPAQNQSLDTSAAHLISCNNHGYSSFGMSLPPGNSSHTSFTPSQPRSSQISHSSFKYDAQHVCSQFDAGSFLPATHESHNGNLWSSNQAIYSQRFGYSAGG